MEFEGLGEARLPVCGVLVLTHNFEVWRPVVARLLVFWDWWLWLQSGQWQNCKSKQVVGFEFLLFTGLKPVVNMCRSYGTFHIMKKDFIRYYLITGLKPVVNMYRSSGTSSPNFSPLFSGRLSIPSFFALNLLKIFIPGELHWGQETTRKSFFRKVCLAAFAESEFGNPFYKGRSWIMGWQIPICQKGRSPLKKVCLTAFTESEFGNPFFFAESEFGNPFFAYLDLLHYDINFV